MYIQEEKANGDEVIASKDQLLREKDQDFVSLQQKCGLLQIQLESVQRKNQSLEVSGCMVTLWMYSKYRGESNVDCNTCILTS